MPLGGKIASGTLSDISEPISRNVIQVVSSFQDTNPGSKEYCLEQTRNGVVGLPRKYLEGKARGMASQENKGYWLLQVGGREDSRIILFF